MTSAPNSTIQGLSTYTPSFMSGTASRRGGALGVARRTTDGRPFECRDLATMRVLAGVAALALDRMRVIERSETVAREAATDTDEPAYSIVVTSCCASARNRTRTTSECASDGGDARRRQFQTVERSARSSGRRRRPARRRRCAAPVGPPVRRLRPFRWRRVRDSHARSQRDSGAQIAERIREDVEGSRPPIGPWSDDLKVTASIGIATGMGISGDDLIARADEALYAAKREGKNRVRLSS